MKLKNLEMKFVIVEKLHSTWGTACEIFAGHVAALLLVGLAILCVAKLLLLLRLLLIHFLLLQYC